MSRLTDRLTAFLLRKTIADLLKDEVNAERDDVFVELAELQEDTGTTKVTLKLPNGDAVADLTIVQPSKKEHVDDAALLAWARESHPEVIERIEHPAQAAWTEERVDMSRLREMGLNVTEDGTVVTTEGEPVDGLTYRTPPSTTFRVAYKKGGRDALMDAWRAGDLKDLPTGKTLRQIGA